MHLQFVNRPQWYIPDGMTRPAHVLKEWGAIQLSRPSGENAKPVAMPDWGEGPLGVIAGGAYNPKSAEFWRKTQTGYWINWQGTNPRQLLRPNAMEGILVTGDNGHEWQVPQLMTMSNAGLVSSLTKVMQVDGTFDIPTGYVSITSRLSNYMLNMGSATENDVNEYTQLAVDLLAMNYYLTREDLGASGWFDMSLIANVIFAAATGEKVVDHVVHNESLDDGEE